MKMYPFCTFLLVLASIISTAQVSVTLGQPPTVVIVDLSNQNLSLPDVIAMIQNGSIPANVTSLILSGNPLMSICGVPWTNLPILDSLILESVELSSLNCSEVLGSSSLTLLYLGFNTISSLVGFSCPSNLQVVSFENNNLTSLDGFVPPTSLQSLDVSGNLFTQFFPDQLPRNLTVFLAKNNPLVGFFTGTQVIAGDNVTALTADLPCNLSTFSVESSVGPLWDCESRINSMGSCESVVNAIQWYCNYTSLAESLFKLQNATQEEYSVPLKSYFFPMKMIGASLVFLIIVFMVTQRRTSRSGEYRILPEEDNQPVLGLKLSHFFVQLFYLIIVGISLGSLWSVYFISINSETFKKSYQCNANMSAIFCSNPQLSCTSLGNLQSSCGDASNPYDDPQNECECRNETCNQEPTPMHCLRKFFGADYHLVQHVAFGFLVFSSAFRLIHICFTLFNLLNYGSLFQTKFMWTFQFISDLLFVALIVIYNLVVGFFGPDVFGSYGALSSTGLVLLFDLVILWFALFQLPDLKKLLKRLQKLRTPESKYDELLRWKPRVGSFKSWRASLAKMDLIYRRSLELILINFEDLPSEKPHDDQIFSLIFKIQAFVGEAIDEQEGDRYSTSPQYGNTTTTAQIEPDRQTIAVQIEPESEVTTDSKVIKTMDEFNNCKDLSSIHELSLSHLRNETLDHLHFFDKLPLVANLQRLNLSQNAFSRENFEKGCNILPNLARLESLDLSENALTGSDCKRLCCMLPRLKSLKTLDLRGNHLDDQGIEIIIQTIKTNPSIMCAILLSNHQLTTGLLKRKDEAISSNRNLSELLKEGELPVTRCRMILCGFAYAGKSTLLSSLSRTMLKKIISNESLKADFDDPDQRTPGIDFVRLSLNGIDLTVLDFGGQPEFYLTHEMFLHDKNTFFVLVCNLLLDSQTRVQQLRFWMRFLQSRFGGGEEGLVQRPDVIIVGTNLDSEEASSNPAQFQAVNDAVLTIFQNECANLQHEFSFLNIHGKTFAVDARKSQSEGVQGLKDYLKQVAEEVMARQPKFPKCCEPLLKWVEKMRTELEKRRLPPLISWEEYFEEVKTWVNPLITEKQLHRMTRYLTQIGEIVFFPHMPSHVFLSPQWIARDIIGVALASDALKHHIKFEENGSVVAKIAFTVLMNKIKTIPRGFTEASFCRFIFDLLELLEICYCSSSNLVYPLEEMFIFPSMMQISMPDIEPLKWTKGDGSVLCFGRRFDCDFITPGIFPHLVIKLRKFFGTFPLIWRGGFQFALPSVECMVECGDVPLASTNMQDCRRFIDVRVRLGRGAELSNEGVLLCHRVMGLVCEMVEEVRYMCSPGCTYELQALSPSLIFEKEMSMRKGYPLDPLLEKKSEEFEIKFGVSESVGSIVGLHAKGLTLKEVHAFVHRLNQLQNDACRARRLLREVQQTKAQPAVDARMVECLQRFENERAIPPLSAFEELSQFIVSSDMPALLFEQEEEQASKLSSLLKSSLIPLCVGFKPLLLYDPEHGDDPMNVRLKTQATKLEDLKNDVSGLKDDQNELKEKQQEHEKELLIHKGSISSMSNDLQTLENSMIRVATANQKDETEPNESKESPSFGHSLLSLDSLCSFDLFVALFDGEDGKFGLAKEALVTLKTLIAEGAVKLCEKELAFRAKLGGDSLHEFVVPCLGLQKVGLFQVMVYGGLVVESCSLHHLIQDISLPLQDVALVARHVLDALRFLHSKNTILGNLTCGSIHYQGGRFKISDLSFACELDSVPADYFDQLIQHHPCEFFLAPEVKPGANHAVLGPWVDVYSLGVLLWELIFAHPDERVPVEFDTVFVEGTKSRVRELKMTTEGKKFINVVKSCLKAVKRATVDELSGLFASIFPQVEAFSSEIISSLAQLEDRVRRDCTSFWPNLHQPKFGKPVLTFEQGDKEIALRVRHFLSNEKFIVPCFGLESLPVDPPLYQLAFAAPVAFECSLHSILFVLHAREGCYKPVQDMDAIKEHMNRELLSPQDVLTVALQCIEAVEYIHSKSLIITTFGCDSFHFHNGRFKLSDLSAAVSTRDVLPSGHWHFHCPKERHPDMHCRAQYAAPEFVGIKREHDPADPDMLRKETERGDAYMTQLIDVFGFGVLLWELLFEHPLVEITPQCFDTDHAVGGTLGRLRKWQADPLGKALIKIAQDCLKGAPERICRPTASDVKNRLMQLCVASDSLSLSEKFMKGVNEKLSLPEVMKTKVLEEA